MKYHTTIDAAGRLVIPKPIRQQLDLRAGTVVDLEIDDGRLMLTGPDRSAALVLRDGILLLGGQLLDSTTDVNSVRMARIDQLANPRG